MSPMGYWLITLGAALRITRFVVVDDLGRWTVKGPFQRYAVDVEIDRVNLEARRVEHAANADHHDRLKKRLDEAVSGERPYSIEQKISHGLECPYCVGTWVSLGAFGLAALASRSKKMRGSWSVLASGLTASFIIGALINHMEPEEGS